MNRILIWPHARTFGAEVAASFRKGVIIVSAIIVLAGFSTFPQNQQLQEKLAIAKEAARENKLKLMQYQWTETTQLTLKGDQKPSRQFLCQYGPDGQVQKTPIGAPPEEPSGGRLKKHVVEKKKAEMQDYMNDVKGVIAMYVPPDPQRMQQAYQAGNMSFNPTPDVMNLIFNNYAQPGDKMTLTFDPATKKITHLSVNTYMGEAKDAVTLEIQMATLPDGTSYPMQTVLNASAKELIVTTTNSNYVHL
ncbi:MAG TPA: hypothetical protein VMU43_04135 [Candidatus Acidoferrum sp.]|nr:hypothetical protein [Candidatus Acidoferrum sp.]